MRADLHTQLIEVVEKLPSDYKPWGQVERWEDSNKNYPDCSMGCKYANWLEGDLKSDWCICVNSNSPRFGKLTFEHQAGLDCYEPS